MSPVAFPTVMIVGSGAVRAHPTRGGASFLVGIGGHRLLFDCGRCAVHNLARFGVPVETITEAYVTHLHFDHMCDLPLLLLLSWNNGRRVRLPVHGPAGIADFLEHGVRQAYAIDIQSRLAHGKDPAGLEWMAREITGDGRVQTTADFTVEALRTGHAGLLNYNFRIRAAGRTIVITSDTEPDPRLVDFCRDADLLLVECSGTREFFARQAWGGWHMTPEDVGVLARDARVRKTVLKHLVIESWSQDPRVSETMADMVRALHPAGEIVVAADGMRFDP